MTEDDLARSIGRGARARELMENELLVEGFATVKAEYIKAWENTPARDDEGRKRLWIMVKLIDKVKGHLESAIEDGKLSQKHLTQLREESKIRKLFG